MTLGSHRAQHSAAPRSWPAQQLASVLSIRARGRAIIVVLLAVIAVACAGTRLTHLVPEQSYVPVPAESVLVFLTRDVIPEPYEPIVAVDMPQDLGGVFAASARREVGAVGSNGFILVGTGGADAGAAVAGGALDAAAEVAAGVPVAPILAPLFARPRVRVIGIRSTLERRHETRPVAVLGGHEFQSISAGVMHTCGVRRDCAAFCWGWNWLGQLGDGSTTAHFEPAQIRGYLDFVSVSAGFAHSCGLRTDGTAYCWGANFRGQLGRGYEAEYSETATPVSGGLVFTALAAGLAHTCGLTRDGAAYCWGDNSKGQLGTGDTTSVAGPTAVFGDHLYAQLAAGFFHTCGVTTAGVGYCWGWNEAGQLGDGSTSDALTRVAVSGGHTFASLTAGRLHTCGLTPTGEAYCWGYGASGALGDGSTKSKRKDPVGVSGELTFQSLSAGAYFTCGLTTEGWVYCWGLTQHGQLGNDLTTEQCKFWSDIEFPCTTTPVLVLTEPSFVEVSAGVAHACAVTTGGSAYCWGAATAGQLGDRTAATGSSGVSTR
jgi:alpha-tubulin suppressor-like RCC1 family protein